MDRKRVGAVCAAVLAILVLLIVASRSLREPQIEANIPAGPNARTQDEPIH